MDIQQTFLTIDTIIKSLKLKRISHNYLGLMEDALALLEYTPSLIEYCVDKESEYRKFEASLTNEEKDGKKNSSAYCETQAKATDYYKDWQKTKLFLELIYEMVNVAKKLANNIDSELNSSSK